MMSIAKKLDEVGIGLRKLGFHFNATTEVWDHPDGFHVEWAGSGLRFHVSRDGVMSGDELKVVWVQSNRGTDEERIDEVVTKVARIMERLR